MFADSYLKDTFTMYVSSKTSLAQRIQNSKVFSERFARNRQHMDQSVTVSPRIQNLRAAKHRMESFQKPLSRVVLYFPALMLTNEQIANERHATEEGKVAKQLDEETNVERALQLAMLADASDENMMLVRFADRGDDCPVEEFMDECEHFLARCRALFDDGQCMNSGYTEYMLSLLHDGILTLVRGQSHQIGGYGSNPLTEEVKSRCLGRMRNWLRLVEVAVRAEFPQESILHAMGVFKLTARKAQRRDPDLGAADKHLDRLAQLLNLNKISLKAEYRDHLPIAQRLFENAGDITNAEAWRQAIAKSADRRHKKAHPSTVLVQALARFLGWSWSTSTAERTFQISKWAMGLSSHGRHHQ